MTTYQALAIPLKKVRILQHDVITLNSYHEMIIEFNIPQGQTA